jgi:hypothetical protein
MSTDTAPAKSALSEDYDELLVAKAVADTRLAMADAKRKMEADKAIADAKQADEDNWIEASAAFSSAYCGWLTATAGVKDPADIPDDYVRERYRAEDEAERRLFNTPAALGEQVWEKLTAFELILGNELLTGARRNSILLLALGSTKQDILNLDLVGGAR